MFLLLQKTQVKIVFIYFLFFLQQRGKTKRETLFVYFSSLFMSQCFLHLSPILESLTQKGCNQV